MSGWTEIEIGNVKMVHHSTSSYVQIIVRDREEYQAGHVRWETTELWLDYSQMDDLIAALKQVSNGDETEIRYYNKAINDAIMVANNNQTNLLEHKELIKKISQLIK